MNQAETPPTGPAPAAAEPLPPIPRKSWVEHVRGYFLGEDPTLLTALVPTVFLSMVLYTRSPATNFIFDEQEALLANPYVRAAADPSTKIMWRDAFHRDFWGLTPDRTIGSYRPLPDIIWRAMWRIGLREQSAFPHAWVNVLLHGLNGALLVMLVFRWTRDRLTAWLAGGLFVATAVVTEAVSGVVGLADVLGGTGALLALLAVGLELRWMSRRPMLHVLLGVLRWIVWPLAVLAATLIGLYSKESALCIVPLVPLAALLTAQISYPERPLRWVRAFVAAAVTAGAFVFYVEMRRRWFPVATPHDLTAEANAGKPWLPRAFATALRWYAQPMLPHDPLNNPLIDATRPQRLAGALRVYTRGIGQVLFPMTLSGDYSAPQEPIPGRLVFPESVIGAAAMVLPLLAAPLIGVLSWIRARKGAEATAEPEIRRLGLPRVGSTHVEDIGPRPRRSPFARVGRRLLLPGLEHPGRASHGSRGALLVFPLRSAHRSSWPSGSQGSSTSDAATKHRSRRQASSFSSSRSSASPPAGTRWTTRTTSSSGTRPERPSREARRRTSPTRSCSAPGGTSKAASFRTRSLSVWRPSGPWRMSIRATRFVACTGRPKRCRTTWRASSSGRTT